MERHKLGLVLANVSQLPKGFNWPQAVEFMLKGTPFKLVSVEVDITPAATEKEGENG